MVHRAKQIPKKSTGRGAGLSPKRDLLNLRAEPAFRMLPLVVAANCLFFVITLVLLILIAQRVGLGSGQQVGASAVVVPVTLNATKQNERALTQSLVKVMQEFPEVSAIEVATQQERLDLLQPWIGAASPQTIPILIRFQMTENAENAQLLQRLQARLNSLSDGVQVFGNQAWQDQNKRTGRVFLFVLLALFFAALLSILVSLVFATRAAMRAQSHSVEVMTILGAEDLYIARIFESFAVRTGLIAGIAAALVCLILWWLFYVLLPDQSQVDSGFVSTLLPTLIVAALSPLLAAGLCGLGAKLGVAMARRHMLDGEA